LLNTNSLRRHGMSTEPRGEIIVVNNRTFKLKNGICSFKVLRRR
jgi:hypothetical protein